MKKKSHFPTIKGNLFALLLAIAAMPLTAQYVWAQDSPGYPVPEDWSKARITDIGVVVSDAAFLTKYNEETQKEDTVLFVSNPETIWSSENVNVGDSTQVARAMQPRRKARNKVMNEEIRDQWGNMKSDYFLSFHYYVFRFEYPSVDADGNEIMLSGIAACPTPKGANKVNNIIMGTHVTITSDAQRPSAQMNNFDREDWGMLMSLAAGARFLLNEKASLILFGAQAALKVGGLLLCMTGFGAIIGAPMMIAGFALDGYSTDQMEKAWLNHDYNNNLVIIADYEGYGITKERAHPYLYQELTARQCVDATRYGRYLYEHDHNLDFLRHSIRSNFLCLSMGYSQGGSVAMACHRFIEQNNLVKELHFVGSVCGDGPYDPMATLMFYVQQDLANKTMKMPVVLPLIVKGMLDTNPYMKSHKAEDYFRPEFLETGILNWIERKADSTDEITERWKRYAKENPGKKDFSRAKMREIMTEDCYNYFLKIYNDNKDTFTSANGVPLPQKRGTMEDLHLALSSNDMTSGWVPSHTIKLFHSKGDNVVPYVNATRAKNALGSKVSLETAPNGLDHVDSGMDFFRGDDDIVDVALNRVLSTRMYDYVDEMCEKNW